MTIAVGDILRVVVSLGYVDGEINQNVYNAVIGGAGGPYDDGDIVDDAVDWAETMYANMVSELTDAIDGTQVQVYVYDPIEDDWDEVGSDTWTFLPTDVTEQLPRGNACLLVARTTDPDVNGKKYIPGLAEGSIGSGLINAPFVATAVSLGVDWLTQFTGAVSGATWDPGIWSVKNSDLYLMSGTLIVSNIVAYQRRRKRGVGI